MLFPSNARPVSHGCGSMTLSESLDDSGNVLDQAPQSADTAPGVGVSGFGSMVGRAYVKSTVRTGASVSPENVFVDWLYERKLWVAGS